MAETPVLHGGLEGCRSNGKGRLNEVMHGRYVATFYDSPVELREGQRRSLHTAFL